MGSQNTMDIFRRNLSALLTKDRLVSKRFLSTSIGADDSYIRKIMTQDTSPSFEKIDAICEFFDVNSWELFYDGSADEKETLATVELINRMPASMLPVVKSYYENLVSRSETSDQSGECPDSECFSDGIVSET